MNLLLKRVYNDILLEKYGDHSSLEAAYQGENEARQTQKQNRILKESIYRIYELEYGLFLLGMERKKAGGWLPDTLDNVYQKWRSELINLLKDSIEKLYRVMHTWSQIEEYRFMIGERFNTPDGQGAPGLFKRVTKKLMLLYPSKASALERVLGDYTSSELSWRGEYERAGIEPSEIDKIIKMVKEDFFEDVWKVQPYRDVEKALEMLKSGASGDIKRDIVLFHKGLTTAHNNGSMAEYAVSVSGKQYGTYDAVVFLHALSDGKWIKEWEAELKKFPQFQEKEKQKEETMSLKEVIEKHPTPEELIKYID